VAPSVSQQYKLNSPTIALVLEGGKQIMLHVPTGSTITVLDSLTSSRLPNRQVEVRWLGKSLLMFAADILERGEKLP
jgi:hypothetical protein